MLKKILKIFFLGTLSLLLLAFISYYSFLGYEYITGGKFVKYLIDNKETVAIDENFSFEIMNEDIEDSKLILVGEIHGFNEPAKFDVEFFKHLYKNFGVRHYLAELDFAQAKFLNTYLETGEDSLLNFILDNWVVVQGRNNKDYYNKYKAFHSFYKELPENEKFYFIGIDKVQDWNVFLTYVNHLSGVDTVLSSLTYNESTVVDDVENRLDELLSQDQFDDVKKMELLHLKKNVEFKVDRINRETVLFQNFYDLYKQEEFQDDKLYGYFGLYHVFQFRINGKHPFASMVRQSDLGLEGKMLSMNFNFVDSYMVVKSATLPEFMRGEGVYSKMPISSDNIWFYYSWGVMDLKRTTGEYQKSLYKMNSDNNPYQNTSRLNTTFQILPVTDIFELNDKGKPYIQYMVFVRNSDWAEPMDN